MFVMSSIAVEHELAYRRHELEKAAHRAQMIRNQAGGEENPVGARSARPSWWRRIVLAG